MELPSDVYKFIFTCPRAARMAAFVCKRWREEVRRLYRISRVWNSVILTGPTITQHWARDDKLWRLCGESTPVEKWTVWDGTLFACDRCNSEDNALHILCCNRYLHLDDIDLVASVGGTYNIVDRERADDAQLVARGGLWRAKCVALWPILPAPSQIVATFDHGVVHAGYHKGGSTVLLERVDIFCGKK